MSSFIDKIKEQVSSKQMLKSYDSSFRREIKKLFVGDLWGKQKFISLLYVILSGVYFVSDLAVGFYEKATYSYLNLSAIIIWALSSIIILIMTFVSNDKSTKCNETTICIYYFCLISGALLFYASDIFRGTMAQVGSLVTFTIIAFFPLPYTRQNIVLYVYGMIMISLIIFLKYGFIPFHTIQNSIIIIIALCIACVYVKTVKIKQYISHSISHELSCEMEIRAKTDFLSKLLNRSALNDFINEELMPLSGSLNVGLIMIDIDDFKSYNDSYSHIVGDEAIKKVSNSLLNIKNDKFKFIYRYGGEEFLVIGLDVDEESLILMGKEIRNNIEQLNIDRKATGKGEVVTVSIGCSLESVNDRIGFEKLLRQSDKQLYIAKSNGKNCVAFNNQIK